MPDVDRLDLAAIGEWFGVECPPSPTGEHRPLASDEGGPVYCRDCQTPLRPRSRS